MYGSIIWDVINKQPADRDTQLAFSWGMLGGNFPWESVWRNARSNVQIPMQDYKAPRVADIISATLVNTQTHTAYDRLYTISSASWARKIIHKTQTQERFHAWISQTAAIISPKLETWLVTNRQLSSLETHITGHRDP